MKFVPFQVFNRFEVFNSRTLSIYANGNVALSVQSYRSLGEPVNVALMFDREHHVIGVQATEDTDAGFRVSRGAARSVACVGFLEYFGIEWRSMRFSATVEDGVLCVDVSEPGLLIGRGRHPFMRAVKSA